MKLRISVAVRAARMLTGGVLIALCGVGVVGGTPSVQAAQRPTVDGTAYDFQRHYKLGEVDRYKGEFVVTTNGPDTGGKDQSVKYTIVSRETTSSVDPDGTVVVIIEYEQAIVSAGGKSEDYTAKMPRIIHAIDSQGRGRITLEGGNDPLARVMVGIMATADEVAGSGTPKKPKKVGETWNLTSPDPNKKLSGTAGLDSVVDINGTKTLKVNYRTDASQGAISAHTGATVWVDVLTGKTIKVASRSDGMTDQGKTTVDLQYNHIDDPNAPISVPQRAYHVGDVDHYQYNVVMTTRDPQAGGNDRVVKYALLLKETVKEVAADGTVTLAEEAEKAVVSADNAELDVTAMMPTITQIRSTQGGFQFKVEGRDAQLMDLVMPMMMQVSRAQGDVIPSRAVKAGSVWRFTRSDSADTRTTGSGSLEAIESLNGVKALKLNGTSDMSGIGAQSTKRRDQATVWADAQTGKTLKMNSLTTSLTGEVKTTVDVAYTLVTDKTNASGGNGK